MIRFPRHGRLSYDQLRQLPLFYHKRLHVTVPSWYSARFHTHWHQPIPRTTSKMVVVNVKFHRVQIATRVEILLLESTVKKLRHRWESNTHI